MPEKNPTISSVTIGTCRMFFGQLFKKPSKFQLSSAAYLAYWDSPEKGFSLFRGDRSGEQACPLPTTGVAYLTNMLHWTMVDCARNTGNLLDTARLPEKVADNMKKLSHHLRAFHLHPDNTTIAGNADRAFQRVTKHLGRDRDPIPLTVNNIVIPNVRIGMKGTLGELLFALHTASFGFQDKKTMPQTIRNTLGSYLGAPGQGVYDTMLQVRHTVYDALIKEGLDHPTANNAVGSYLSEKELNAMQRVMTRYMRELTLVDLCNSLTHPGAASIRMQMYDFLPDKDIPWVNELHSAKEVALIVYALAAHYDKTDVALGAKLLEYSNALMGDEKELKHLSEVLATLPQRSDDTQQDRLQHMTTLLQNFDRDLGKIHKSEVELTKNIYRS